MGCGSSSEEAPPFSGVNPKVYFDIEIGGQSAGRVEGVNEKWRESDGSWLEMQKLEKGGGAC